MKTLVLILTLISISFSQRILLKEPVIIDSSFPLSQISDYVDYLTFDEMKDSGIVATRKDIFNKDNKTIQLYQNCREEALETLFSLLYVSVHIKSVKDCSKRWEILSWFRKTAEKLDIPENLIVEGEESMIEFMLNLCSDLYQGRPIGEPVIPSP